ncbi:MAG: phytanoyl-CoA dioxygenase family protein [Pirellulaceae bacterium]|jgi:non-heme Fe2+,alpha-ketoglutarate-dependent halogenase|nr:phytanoyl-CoA dioxygenase family protein [Pirellulaceae bacterium]
MIKVDEIANPNPSQLAELPRVMGFVPATNNAPRVLTKQQIDDYNSQGYLMPFDGLQEGEARELRAFFDGVLAAFIELGRTSYSISTAHLRFKRIYELVQHPAIVSAVSDLLGPNVVCWGSHFFCKMPKDGKRVPWHQDSTYWPLSPTKTVTVWLAIDDADPENANMKFIPRSHLHGLIDYDESQDADTVLDLAVKNPQSYGDAEVDVALKAGQFSMHSDLLLHGSEANQSDRRRSGLTIRFAAADVTTWYGWHQKGVIVRGADPNQHWLNPPSPAV